MSALERLKAERKLFRRERNEGFSAKPITTKNGELNLFMWNAKIPGKKKTPFEDGLYSVTLKFPKDYPQQPPTAIFTPPIFHANVYEDGEVCLSLLNIEKDWKPSISVNTILKSLQNFLDDPNAEDPANSEAFSLFKHSQEMYNEKVRNQAKQFKPID